MNLLVLAAGESISDVARGGYPIWLAELDGELMLERQVKALARLNPSRIVFAFRKEDIDAYHVDDIARLLAPGCTIIEVTGVTSGAVCTALLAIGSLDPNEELVVASATDHIDVDFVEVVRGFKERCAQAGVVLFDSLHPRYSYARLTPEGFVVEMAEKRPISRDANAGVYWFEKAEDFIAASKNTILKDGHVNGKFYLSTVLNQIVLKQMKIASHRISSDQYHPLKGSKHVDDLGHRTEERPDEVFSPGGYDERMVRRQFRADDR